MGYLVAPFYSNWLTILQQLLGKISPILALLYGSCTLILKHFFSQNILFCFPD